MAFSFFRGRRPGPEIDAAPNDPLANAEQELRRRSIQGGAPGDKLKPLKETDLAQASARQGLDGGFESTSQSIEYAENITEQKRLQTVLEQLGRQVPEGYQIVTERPNTGLLIRTQHPRDGRLATINGQDYLMLQTLLIMHGTRAKAEEADPAKGEHAIVFEKARDAQAAIAENIVIPAGGEFLRIDSEDVNNPSKIAVKVVFIQEQGKTIEPKDLEHPFATVKIDIDEHGNWNNSKLLTAEEATSWLGK